MKYPKLIFIGASTLFMIAYLGCDGNAEIEKYKNDWDEVLEEMRREDNRAKDIEVQEIISDEISAYYENPRWKYLREYVNKSVQNPKKIVRIINRFNSPMDKHIIVPDNSDSAIVLDEMPQNMDSVNTCWLVEDDIGDHRLIYYRLEDQTIVDTVISSNLTFIDSLISMNCSNNIGYIGMPWISTVISLWSNGGYRHMYVLGLSWVVSCNLENSRPMTNQSFSVDDPYLYLAQMVCIVRYYTSNTQSPI